MSRSLGGSLNAQIPNHFPKGTHRTANTSLSQCTSQTLTHNLCYTFARATRAVSVCPPAYYADLLCERGRCYRFTDLAENVASASSVSGEEDQGVWTRDVHPNLQDSTWYV